MTEQTDNTPGYLIRNVMEKCARLNIPTQAILELTYRCNLHCVHCYVDIDEPDELATDEWKDVIDQLKSSGVISLLITGGETLLRDDFREIISHIRRRGFFFSISTNGTLLNYDIVNDIAKLKPFIVNTSLYGASALTHEAVTRVPGSFEMTIQAIKVLVNSGIKTLIQTVAMKSNAKEISGETNRLL